MLKPPLGVLTFFNKMDNYSLFLWQMKSTYVLYSIAISILLGLFAGHKKNTDLYIKVFPFFLMLSFLVEIIGEMRNNRGLNTLIVYNLFNTIEFSFYIWMIREIIQNGKAKKIIFYILLIYPIVDLINIFFVQGTRHFHTLTYSLGCLLVVLLCIYYFFELFQAPNSVNLARQPAFWICTGLLFFYCCSFPIFGLSNFLQSLPRVFRRNMITIIILLNVFLYSMFTLAFLCRFRITKSSR
jgi:hypothetical protein